SCTSPRAASRALLRRGHFGGLGPLGRLPRLRFGCRRAGCFVLPPAWLLRTGLRSATALGSTRLCDALFESLHEIDHLGTLVLGRSERLLGVDRVAGSPFRL